MNYENANDETLNSDEMYENNEYSSYGTNGYFGTEDNAYASDENSEYYDEYEVYDSNIVLGIIGAIIGAALGSILWIVIGKIGFIAGIAGLLIAQGAFKGYEMLGGSLDKKGVIASVVISVFVIYYANKVCWAWEVYDNFVDTYNYQFEGGQALQFFKQCYTNLYYIIQESGNVGYYVMDIIVGYGLTIWSSYKTIKQAYLGKI